METKREPLFLLRNRETTVEKMLLTVYPYL